MRAPEPHAFLFPDFLIRTYTELLQHPAPAKERPTAVTKQSCLDLRSVYEMSAMQPEKKLCVYCGSGHGRNPAHRQAARTLGRMLAEAGIGLVYGGGGLGLMGETARACLEAGGHVTGIIPEFLIRKEIMLENINELVVTTNMHERKMTMFEKSDGFCALPGGIGTLEELVEISTWAQLGQHVKPIIVANIDGYWDPLMELISHMREEGFFRSSTEVRFDAVTRAEDIIPLFEKRLKIKRKPAWTPEKLGKRM